MFYYSLKKKICLLVLFLISIFAVAEINATDITLTLGDVNIIADVPAVFTAYQYITIPYVISGEYDEPIAFEAVAFEEDDKLLGRELFDCALPGDMTAEVELLNIIISDWNEDKVNNGVYPPIDRFGPDLSSTIAKRYMTHFTFSVRNIGDTIWDGEGYGAICFRISAYNMQEERIYHPDNSGYQYLLDYVYPGESAEICIPIYTYRIPQNGQYIVYFEICYIGQNKYQHRQAGPYSFIGRYTFPLTLADEDANTPIEPIMTYPEDQRSYYTQSIHQSFDEFMTSYRIHHPSGSDQGQLELMVAPWTTAITLKLITPEDITTQRIPITVDRSQMALTYNPQNAWTVTDNNKPLPAIMPKSMPCIRESYYKTPFPENNITALLEKAQTMGVRVMGMMCYNWGLWGFRDKTYDAGNRSTYFWGPTMEYYFEECRRLGLKVLWWGSYEFQTIPFEEVAAVELNDYRWPPYLSRADPNLITAIGCYIDWAIDEYGEIMYRTVDDRLPVVFDFGMGMAWHVGRRPVGSTAEKIFIEQMQSKYGSITNLNAAWNWNYQDFSEIDPEPEGQHRLYYNETTAPFIPGTTAMQDWDNFRAESWANFMISIRAELQKRHPEIIVGFLDESHQVFGLEGDPNGNVFERVIYEFNKVHAILPSMLEEQRPVDFIGNYNIYGYDNFNYVEQGVANTASWGIDSFYQPSGSHFGKIVEDPDGPILGSGYEDVYTGEPFLAQDYSVIHAMHPLYPHFKIHYENSSIGACGWSDYACHHFATHTQEREIEEFITEAREMLAQVPPEQLEEAEPHVSAYVFEQDELAQNTEPELHLWFHGGSFNSNGQMELRVALVNYSGQDIMDVSVHLSIPEGWNAWLIGPGTAVTIEDGARQVFRFTLQAIEALYGSKELNETVEITAVAKSEGSVFVQKTLHRFVYLSPLYCNAVKKSDINCDGIVDLFDLVIFAEHWLESRFDIE